MKRSGHPIDTNSPRRRRKTARWMAVLGALVIVPAALLLAVHVGIFELGDGTGAPGTADILGNPLQAGPDWADLFNADGSLKDTDGNGVPDFEQIYGGLAAIFVKDDTS